MTNDCNIEMPFEFVIINKMAKQLLSRSQRKLCLCLVFGAKLSNITLHSQIKVQHFQGAELGLRKHGQHWSSRELLRAIQPLENILSAVAVVQVVDLRHKFVQILKAAFFVSL